ncbi:MAG TPA: hypothetical protein VF111_11970 [Thermoanaerobaculia bacterium]
MKKRDLHVAYDFFEYVRISDSVPEADPGRIDVALLDMNHAWPNVGHDSLAHVILEAAETFRDDLVATNRKVRLLSYDVRRDMRIPEGPGRFRLYVGTGGPGHLDPRQNDGVKEWSQGILEDPSWEAPLFRLFDEILASNDAAMFAVCHSFGLVCRWSGIAQPQLRAEKSTGMPLNRLSREALRHPWFEQFARELPDHQHFRVIDNRLFDLILEDSGKSIPVAFEATGSTALTMIELARHPDGMPRFLGMNHHPEIIDRDHFRQVLDEKLAHHEVDQKWCDEREATIRELFQDPEKERHSRLTSHYTLFEPLRHQLGRVIRHPR